MFKHLLILFALLISNNAFAKRLAVLDFRSIGANQTVVELLADQVRETVLNETKGSGIDVMTQENMLMLLKAQGKSSACVDGECEVEIGKNIGADYVVSGKVKVIEGTWFLTLRLYETAKGKLLASKTIDKNSGKAMIKAISRECADLTEPLQSLGSSGIVLQTEGAIGGQKKKVMRRKGKKSVVAFRSTPPGAIVIVDGDLLCQSTPCSKSLSQGSHTVQMQAERHHPKSQVVKVKAGTEVAFELKPRFGWLSVNTAIPLAVAIDGEPAGKTPITRLELDPGPHTVQLQDTCHVDHGQRILITEGQARSLKLKVEAREAGIDISLTDKKGNDLSGEVIVDGKSLGQAPGEFVLPLCSQTLTVKTQKGQHTEALKLEEGEMKTLVLEIVDIYKRDKGVSVDKTKNLRSVRKACDDGTMQACSRLGRMYRLGDGVRKDKAKAVTYFRKACDGGEMYGCAMLGFMYDLGRGVRKDKAKAVRLYRKACDSGLMNGCIFLGNMYKFGAGGLRKNLTKARALFRKACDAGIKLGCDNLNRTNR